MRLLAVYSTLTLVAIAMALWQCFAPGDMLDLTLLHFVWMVSILASFAIAFSAVHHRPEISTLSAAPVQAYRQAPGNPADQEHRLPSLPSVFDQVSGVEGLLDPDRPDVSLAGRRTYDDIPFETDLDLKITYLGPAWRELLGQIPEACIGQPLLDFVSTADRARNAEQLRMIVEGLSFRSWYDTHLQHIDGAEVPIEMRIRAHTTPDGRCHGILGSVSRLPAGYRDQQNQKSQQTVTTMFGGMPCLIYRGRDDRLWTMEFMSDGCTELTGYTPQEFTSRGGMSYGLLIHADDRNYVWTEVQRRLADRTTFQLTYRILTRSGEQKWVTESGHGIFSSTGTLLAIEGFVIDVTSYKQAPGDAKSPQGEHLASGLLSRTAFVNKLQLAQRQSQEGMIWLSLWRVVLGSDDQGAQLSNGTSISLALLDIATALQSRLGPTDFLCQSDKDTLMVALTRPCTGQQYPPAEETGPPLFDLYRQFLNIKALVGHAIAPEGIHADLAVTIGVINRFEEFHDAEQAVSAICHTIAGRSSPDTIRLSFLDAALQSDFMCLCDLDRQMNTHDSSDASAPVVLDLAPLHLAHRPIKCLPTLSFAWSEIGLRWRPSDGEKVPIRNVFFMARRHGLLTQFVDTLIDRLLHACNQYTDTPALLRQLPICLRLDQMEIDDVLQAHLVDRLTTLDPTLLSRLMLQISAPTKDTDLAAYHAFIRTIRKMGLQIVMSIDMTATARMSQALMLPADYWRLFPATSLEVVNSRHIISMIPAAQSRGIRLIATGLRSMRDVNALATMGFGYADGPAMGQISYLPAHG